MATKIRLGRHGKKGRAFYHIIVADSRAPRDGKFIEKIGTYNPNTNPATIELDFDRALDWLQKGAQPTDTVRNILSYKGVLYKKHLLGGVAKGAFSENDADVRFEKWLKEKASAIDTKSSKLTSDKVAAEKARQTIETKLKEEKAKAVAAKKEAARKAATGEPVEEAADEAAEEIAEVAEETPVTETAVEPIAEEAPAVEAPVETVVETVVDIPIEMPTEE